MARKVLYFNEYVRRDSNGSEIHPYYDPIENSWFDNTYRLSMIDLGKLYNIGDEELTILRLTYGG